jgi:hypothetical protein
MKITKEVIIAAIKRFARTFIPQIPALLVGLYGMKPDWVPVLVFLGAVATALDKLCRDLGVY